MRGEVTVPNKFLKSFLWIPMLLVFQLGLISAETINYSYDTMGRLMQIVYGDGTTIEYTYDKMGNRTQKTVSVNGPSCSEAARIEGSPGGYATLNLALAAAQNGDAIKARNRIFSEPVAITINLVLDGGYNCDYSGKSGNTTIGPLSVDTGGQLTIGNFIIK